MQVVMQTSQLEQTTRNPHARSFHGLLNTVVAPCDAVSRENEIARRVLAKAAVTPQTEQRLQLLETPGVHILAFPR